jgi:hypothetical protein
MTSKGINFAAMGLPVRKVAKSKTKAVSLPKASKLLPELNKLAILLGIPKPTPEFRFHPVRKWRFDAAYPEFLIAVEYEGMGGRHQTWTGFIGDRVKYNEAQVMGWMVLGVTVKTMGTLPDLLERAFKLRREA